ncbi:MAG: GNAT family N-acetyltransferase [Puniceicoccaceae bacterium]|nr:MAG: GNAT family N-acetyltransferase [Puniceicoccaceae bacterium]
MAITVQPLTPERWADFAAIFEARGCSIARGCWCMYYRETGRAEIPAGRRPAELRKERMEERVRTGPPPGLLAYRDNQPVGWMSLGPREDFVKLRRSPVMKPVDETPVWSIVCFVVPSAFRHQGVARELLRGAIHYARGQGASWLEAYPVDKPERGHDDWMWLGAKSMFDKAGFDEVARRRPQRPVMRLDLRAATGGKG